MGLDAIVFVFWMLTIWSLVPLPWKETYDQPRWHIQKQRYYFSNKGPSSQGYGFSSGHVWMWELDCEESWELKNWCFWIVLLEKTLTSPLDCKDIQPVLCVHWKDLCWSWNSNTLATSYKELTHWKRPRYGRDWGQEEKGKTEDEMAGWHHRLDGHDFV